MDAVYLMGLGRARGLPLRYSLRSLVNLRQVDRVVIAGALPVWVTDVEYIPIPQGPHKHLNTARALQAALTGDRVTSEFVLMNDDFFVMEPVDEVPVLHRGPITEQIENHNRTGRIDLMTRRSQLQDMLTELGVETPLCYELHTPMPVDKAAMAEALSRAAEVRPAGMEPTGKRTLYANLAQLGGTCAVDVKARGVDQDLPAGPFVSTAPPSWTGAVGRAIRERFAERSPWEHPGWRATS